MLLSSMPSKSDLNKNDVVETEKVIDRESRSSSNAENQNLRQRSSSCVPSSSTTGLDLYLHFHWGSRYWAPIFFINRPSPAIIDAKPFSFRQEWRRRFALPASIHSIKPNQVDIYYTHSLNTFNKVKFYRMLSTLAVVFSTYTIHLTVDAQGPAFQLVRFNGVHSALKK